MTGTASADLTLPVDAATLAALHQAACIVCGATSGPLRPAGWRTTAGPDGTKLGWAVAACPAHGLNDTETTP